jgi:hypothetical protein
MTFFFEFKALREVMSPQHLLTAVQERAAPSSMRTVLYLITAG